MAPRTNSSAARPPTKSGIIHFEGVPPAAALDIYKKLTGLELTIAAEVDLCAGIYLNLNLNISGADGVTLADARKFKS